MRNIDMVDTMMLMNHQGCYSFYDDLTKEEFVTLIGIHGKSKLLKNPKKSHRGKPSPYSKLRKK